MASRAFECDNCGYKCQFDDVDIAVTDYCHYCGHREWWKERSMGWWRERTKRKVESNG